MKPKLESRLLGEISITSDMQMIPPKRQKVKSIYFCFIDYAKAFDCVDHNKVWKEMGIADHLTCLLRNLYAGQESNS